MSNLELLAIDIETTGFNVDDEVTVMGVALPGSCQVACQTGGRSAEDLEARVGAQCAHDVDVTVFETEKGLLRAMRAGIRVALEQGEYLVIAYNGETWQGGFDLPFLRTRFAHHDMSWPFGDAPYADLLPIVEKLFNTTVDGTAENDLPTAHELLCSDMEPAPPADPFDDSAEAVTAFEEGRFDELVRHNVADIVRTRQLGTLAQQYCSKSDFDLKSLTPVDGMESESRD
jgi:uncharacterized protein YprB with RNaseH-like and TPR domain